jgi:dephospho-CoA kinase
MFSFKDFDKQSLQEKLVVVNKGKKEGQVIFLAGGAGSGKGFAIDNFIAAESYKVVNPDDLKVLALSLGKKKPDEYPEYADLDMKNPEDVAKLHAIIKGKGLFPKKMSMLIKKTESGMLPNLLIDKTMKDVDDFYEFLPTLLRAGYKPQNIHLIWVLTDYRMALVQNRKRARTVPDKILIKTHKGAARTMRDYFIRNYPPDINGEFYVIIGGPQNTVFFSNNKGKALNGSDGLPFAIKDFQYFKLKNAGRSNIDKDSEIARKVYDLVDRYAPDLNEEKTTPTGVAPYFYVRPDYSDMEIDPELRDFYIRMIAAILERQRKSKFRVVKPTEVAPELDYDPYDPPMGTKPIR